MYRFGRHCCWSPAYEWCYCLPGDLKNQCTTCQTVVKKAKTTLAPTGHNCCRHCLTECTLKFYSELKDVEVNTVDGFQGREKDAIIMSCVRAQGSSGAIGWVPLHSCCLHRTIKHLTSQWQFLMWNKWLTCDAEWRVNFSWKMKN